MTTRRGFSPGKLLVGGCAVLAVVLAVGFVLVVFFDIQIFPTRF